MYINFQSISYDHVELNFFLNGKSLDCPITSVRGTVYPVFYGMSVTDSVSLSLISLSTLFQWMMVPFLTYSSWTSRSLLPMALTELCKREISCKCMYV